MALELPDTYYERLSQTYGVKRDRMLGILFQGAGFKSAFQARSAPTTS